MSGDDADPEILALLREQLGFSKPVQQGVSSDTGVLRDAEHICYNSIDVFIDMYGTQSAAHKLYKAMQERNYSTQAWSEHELHPKLGNDVDEVGLINFIFTMDLLNFSFWSELDAESRYQVEYRGKRWTGYNSLVACLRRALGEGTAITTPSFWRTDSDFDQTMKRVFRSATAEEVPLLSKRVAILREAAEVLHERFGDEDNDQGDDDLEVEAGRDDHSVPVVTEEADSLAISKDHGVSTDHTESGADTGSAKEVEMEDVISEDHPSEAQEADPEAATDPHEPEMSGATETQTSDANDQTVASTPDPTPRPSRLDLSVIHLIEEADHSAGKLVNLLAKHFNCFRDEGRFDGRKVRFLKRAQIFVADLWAAFNGKGYGHFHDIHHLTMFADYRVPQMLYNLGVLSYSPPLDSRIRRQVELEPGHSWEMQLRGSSIWAVELLRRHIVRDHPEAEAEVHSVLLDFLLYDLAKEVEASGKSA